MATLSDDELHNLFFGWNWKDDADDLNEYVDIRSEMEIMRLKTFELLDPDQLDFLKMGKYMDALLHQLLMAIPAAAVRGQGPTSFLPISLAMMAMGAMENAAIDAGLLDAEGLRRLRKDEMWYNVWMIAVRTILMIGALHALTLSERGKQWEIFGIGEDLETFMRAYRNLLDVTIRWFGCDDKHNDSNKCDD